MDESQFNLLLTGAKATKEEQDRIEAENKKIAELRERRREEFAPYRYLLEPDELIPDLGTLTDDYWDAKKKEYKERHERHLEELAAKKVEEEKGKEANGLELMGEFKESKTEPQNITSIQESMAKLNDQITSSYYASKITEFMEKNHPPKVKLKTITALGESGESNVNPNFDDWIVIGEVAGKKMVLHPDLYKSLMSGGQHDQIALI